MEGERGSEAERDRKRDERRRQTLARAVVGAAALAILATAIAVLTGADQGDALLGGGLALTALLLGTLAVAPWEAVRVHLLRVRSLKVGFVGLELSDYAKLAAGKAPDEEEAHKAGARGDRTFETLLDLRVGLEMKLAYIAKHILAPSPSPEAPVPTFLTVGSLDFDGYLTRDQTRIAYDILTMRPFEFRSLTSQESRLFLDGAWKFVDAIRVNVFAAEVRKALERADWQVLPAATKKRRRDLLVQSKDRDSAVQHHVIPVFALSHDSSLLELPAKRLATSTFGKAGGGRFLVVPPLSNSLDSSVPEGVRIVKPPGLLEEISRDRPSS